MDRSPVAILSEGSSLGTMESMFGHRQVPEPALTRDEVLDIFGGLADIHANTLEILRILREEDDEEEDA